VKVSSDERQSNAQPHLASDQERVGGGTRCTTAVSASRKRARRAELWKRLNDAFRRWRDEG
jgi:hypothetical protein